MAKFPYRLSAVVEAEDGAFVAHCTEVGVASQGETRDEALANLREAVTLWLKHAEPSELKRLARHAHEPLFTTISVSA